MVWDFAPLQLTFGAVDRRSLIDRLNESRGGVVADLTGDILVIRPVRQPTVAGMPVYYGGRPEFRGTLEDKSGQVVVKGSVQHSSLPVVFNVLGGAFAVFGALAGVLIILAGDVSGFLAVLFAALTGVALFAGTLFLRHLSRMDERAIMSALTAVADDAKSPAES